MNNWWRNFEVEFREDLHGRSMGHNPSNAAISPEYWQLRDEMMDLQTALYKRIDLIMRTVCTPIQMERFHMYYIEQMTYEQIAKAQNVSVISVYYSLCGRKGFGKNKKLRFDGAIQKVKTACAEDNVCRQILFDIRETSAKMAEMEEN